jgi:hypothetical protein
LRKAQELGIKAWTRSLQRRALTPSAASREALRAQLEKLSAEEAQTLLKRVLDEKGTG